MRFVFSLIFIVILGFGPAYAECNGSALGTSRTLALDAAKHRFLTGTEKALALRDKEVILTFDDGPLARTTSRVLNALAKECVKATFFAVGKMAQNHRKLTRRIVRDGHTLAHHTHDHDRLPRFSARRASELVDQGIREVEQAGYGTSGESPRVPFFRFPYLDHDAKSDRVIADRNMIAFGANIDSRDWKKVSASKVHDKIMALLKRERKGIILMHDIQTRTAKMLPRLLRSLKAGGYKVVHIVPSKGHQEKEPAGDLIVAAAPTPSPTPRAKPDQLPILEPIAMASPIGEHTKRQARQHVSTALEPLARSVRAPGKASLLTRSKVGEGGPAQQFAQSAKGWKLRPSQWIIQ